ncbi:MAG: hypothetical protein ACI4QC_03060 [Thermoguttaceae bacterium]
MFRLDNKLCLRMPDANLEKFNPNQLANELIRQHSLNLLPMLGVL